jgi:hypothetical protein
MPWNYRERRNYRWRVDRGTLTKVPAPYLKLFPHYFNYMTTSKKIAERANRSQKIERQDAVAPWIEPKMHEIA